jgi:hypothetical protein
VVAPVVTPQPPSVGTPPPPPPPPEEKWGSFIGQLGAFTDSNPSHLCNGADVPCPATPEPNVDPSWDLRGSLTTSVFVNTLAPPDWDAGSTIEGSLPDVAHLVGFYTYADVPPAGVSVKGTHYYPLNVTDPEDPTYWGYWAEEWIDGGTITFDKSPKNPKLASQVWIAGPQTPTSVIDNLINNPSTPIYKYAGNVLGGVGRDPILMNSLNKINIGINFAAQTATAVIGFQTVKGLKWDFHLTTSTPITLNRNDGYKYKIDVDNWGKLRIVRPNNTEVNLNDGGTRNSLEGYFYGNNAEFTGGTFKLESVTHGTANGVFKAKRAVSP